MATSGIVSASWLTDFTVAKAQAKEQGKDLLIAFTGSDWDAWSAKFLKDALETDEFLAAAPKHFILLQIDFPIHQKSDDEEKVKREELKTHFGVKGYPTLVLTDSSAVPYSYLKYQKGDAKSLIEMLQRTQNVRVRRDNALKDIAALTGLEKADKISRLVTNMTPQILGFHPELIDQLKKADPKDEVGYFQRAKLLPIWKQETQNINGLFRKKSYLEIVKTVDDFIAKHQPTGRVLQEVLTPKLYAVGNMDDVKGAEAIAEQIKAASPDSPASERVDKLIVKLKEIVARKQAAKNAPSKQGVPPSIARPVEEPQPKQ